MVGIDTNVLLRYIVGDDAGQEAVATLLLAGLTPENQGFICREVVLETVWVLERSYRFSRARIATELAMFINSDRLVLETAEDVARAARLYGESNHDFSDLMILEASRRAGALPLYTFDRRLSRMEGAVLAGG